MKKLLTTILAFSCAFGAWAEVKEFISGTDFSTYPVGVFSTETDDSGLTGLSERYWFTGNKEDFDGEVVNVSSNEETGVENYLEFESNITNPVYRTIEDCYNVQSPDAVDEEGNPIGFKPQKIGTGIFIDTVVQFTPYLVNENHPAPEPLTNKDKIIVWVKETESPFVGVANTTNLVVTAGKIGAGATVSPEQYVINCDADALCKGQHRLTIKAFEDISADSRLEIAGFVVYIDGEEVSYLDNEQEAFAIDVSLDTTPGRYYTNEKKSLFPSLMGNTSDGTPGGDEISAVGFAGMGQVGEVWFDDYSTAYPAFAGDNINFQIIVDDSVASYEYNGQTYYGTQTFAVKPGTESIVVTNVTYADGWKAKAGTWFAGATQVMNAGSADGDWGTFSFANGSQFTIAGFKANFLVGNDEYETFLGNISENGGALAAAIKFGNELKMMSDVDVSQSIQVNVGESLTIDLNGHTIMLRGNYETTIRNAGTLTINDSKGGGKVLGVINGTEYVNISIINAGTLTINGGSYEGVLPKYVIDEEAETTIGSATINGGKFALAPIFDETTEEEIKPTASDFYLTPYLGGSNLEVTISQDKERLATGDAFNGINEVPQAYYATVAAPAGDDDEVVSYTITYDSEHGTLPAAVTVTVTNDTSYALTANELPTLTEDGFTFDGWSLTEGGEAVKIGDTISANTTLYALWTEVVAKIGETEYTSLADAIAAATDESTIKIIADIDTDGAFVIEKTVTIDLNGKTIATTENDKSGDGVFWVKTGGTLTINDTVGSGVINGVGGNGYNIGIWALGGRVIINGGNFTNEGATDDGPDGDHFDLIYAKNGGIVEITGGTFKCQTPKWTLNSYNLQNGTPGTFVVTGGKFYQYDPTNINTDDQPVTNWCPAGYKATVDGDYYTVERIPEVTVTLPAAPANTTLEAFVGEDEVEITDNVITVLAGSSVVLKLTAHEGYEFSKDVTVYTRDAVVVNENADWSSIVLPAVTQIVTDPWAPAAETDAAAQDKVAEIFEDSPAAIASIKTYAQYTNLVAYVKAVKEKEDVVDFDPEDLTVNEKLYIVDSLKLGAKELFTDEPKIKLTESQPSTKPGAEAGDWEFNVKVTQGSADAALEVAVEKVKALVKICSDLKNGQWAAPQAANIDAAQVIDGNEITITIKFGDAKSGFMMIAE